MLAFQILNASCGGNAGPFHLTSHHADRIPCLWAHLVFLIKFHSLRFELHRLILAKDGRLLNFFLYKRGGSHGSLLDEGGRTMGGLLDLGRVLDLGSLLQCHFTKALDVPRTKLCIGDEPTFVSGHSCFAPFLAACFRSRSRSRCWWSRLFVHIHLVHMGWNCGWVRKIIAIDWNGRSKGGVHGTAVIVRDVVFFAHNNASWSRKGRPNRIFGRKLGVESWWSRRRREGVFWIVGRRWIGIHILGVLGLFGFQHGGKE
jgi:hypothetical protein